MSAGPFSGRAAWFLSLLAASVGPAAAQTSATPDQPPAGLLEQARLTGDCAGIRTSLEDAGVTFGAVSTNEVFGNPSGGMRQGTVFEGNLQLYLTVDLDKLVGWSGATFRASGYEIYGRGLTANYVGNLLTVSSIEATRSTRLYDLYLEQSLFGGAMSVRIGQFGADEEFMISQYATLFINSTFGWPGLPANDLPSGGPAYPLATPGARIKAQVGDQLTLLAAVFNGNPAGPGTGNPQIRDASGTLFSINDGVFAIAEAQYAINQGSDATGLPGTYRIGGWYKSERFANQDSTGVPQQYRGDYSVYAVADQMIWRKSGTKDEGVGVFARLIGAPSDRNLIDFYADAGVTWKGPIEGRPDDTVGLSMAYAHLSNIAPVGTGETVLELTYQYQIAPWWLLQPDLQYVFNPGGGVPNPDQPGQRVGNAVVLGLRTVITF